MRKQLWRALYTTCVCVAKVFMNPPPKRTCTCTRTHAHTHTCTRTHAHAHAHTCTCPQLVYTGIEAKTVEGCPTAEWVIGRPSKEELFLVLYRHHEGHTCKENYTAISIVLWDGISHDRAKQLYKQLTETLPVYGIPTCRRCATNER